LPGADDEPWDACADRPLLFRLAEGRCRGILYTTKASAIPALEAAWPRLRSYDIVGRYGLMTEEQLDLVALWAGRRRMPVRFVGDLDPYDLMVFGSFFAGARRRGMAPSFHGPDASWLRSVERGRTGVSPFIKMKRFERELLTTLKTLDFDWGRHIDAESMRLLDAGLKLELEGALNPVLYRPSHLRHIGRLLCRTNRFPP
jgi:hypothetical protein